MSDKALKLNELESKIYILLLVALSDNESYLKRDLKELSIDAIDSLQVVKTRFTKKENTLEERINNKMTFNNWKDYLKSIDNCPHLSEIERLMNEGRPISIKFVANLILYKECNKISKIFTLFILVSEFIEIEQLAALLPVFKLLYEYEKKNDIKYVFNIPIAIKTPELLRNISVLLSSDENPDLKKEFSNEFQIINKSIPRFIKNKRKHGQVDNDAFKEEGVIPKKARVENSEDKVPVSTFLSTGAVIYDGIGRYLVLTPAISP